MAVQVRVLDTDMETFSGPESQYREDRLCNPAGDKVYEPSEELVGTRKRKKFTFSVPVPSTCS